MSEMDWQATLERAQRARVANVVCMKWGDRYGPEWVNRLYGMTQRNTTWTVCFVCFTDDPHGIRPEVECRPLPKVEFDAESIGKYWPKLGLMQPGVGGLDGLTLFLDLDIVVIGGLDELLACPGRFCIIREWKRPELGFGNSSVVRFLVGDQAQVLERFYATPPEVIRETYGSKEQNFLTRAAEGVTFWPAEWCVPFPLVCLSRNRMLRFFSTPRQPSEGKIIVFYGSITPRTAMTGRHEPNKRVGQARRLSLTRRRFKPAAWIAQYWRE